MEQYKDAIDICEYMIKLDPNFPIAYNTKGKIYFMFN